MTKTNTARNWALKNIASGKIYYNFSSATRSAARRLANTKRFKGLYTPVSVNKTPNKTTIKAMKEASTIAKHTKTTPYIFSAPHKAKACPSTTSKHSFFKDTFSISKCR